jgi:hypothetical protein
MAPEKNISRAIMKKRADENNPSDNTSNVIAFTMVLFSILFIPIKNHSPFLLTLILMFTEIL